MDTKKIDKSDWSDGPWMSEPDRLDFEAAGLRCSIVRHARHGHLCGYVAVPPGHPLHGLDYYTAHDREERIEAHGGLTYADDHHPQEKPDGSWWFGFDCAHSTDFVPGMSKLRGMLSPSSAGDVYRSIAYVRFETDKLAAVLADHATKPLPLPAGVIEAEKSTEPT